MGEATPVKIRGIWEVIVPSSQFCCEPGISLEIVVKISIFNLSENKIFLSIMLKTETIKKDQRILLHKIKISLIENWKIVNAYDKAYEILIASKFKTTLRDSLEKYQ